MNDLNWWVSVVEIPVISTLFWWIWRIKTDAESNLLNLREQLEHRSSQLREALANHKLETAKNYAQNADLKELETKLVAHLLRIEAKLDTTALKAEALQARTSP